MFGDEAKNSLIREQRAKIQRENDAANLLPGLYQGGNLHALGGQILRANPSATNLGNVNLARTALDAGENYNDPRLATAALGAGHSFEGTVPGLGVLEGGRNSRNAATISGENLRNEKTIAGQLQRAQMEAEKTAETQRAIAERNAATQEAIAARQRDLDERKNQNTPYVVYPNGRPTVVRQNEAYGQPGKRSAHARSCIGGNASTARSDGATSARSSGCKADATSRQFA